MSNSDRQHCMPKNRPRPVHAPRCLVARERTVDTRPRGVPVAGRGGHRRTRRRSLDPEFRHHP